MTNSLLHRKHALLLSLGFLVGVQMFFNYHQTGGFFGKGVNTQLKFLELPYGEADDLRIGKSCIYRSPSRYPFLPLLGKNPWRCTECTASPNGGAHRCHVLKRRGRCPPFRRKEVDQKPRVSTSFNSFTTQKSSTRVYIHDGHSGFALRNVPACTATLSLPCFNLTRCSRFGALKIYPYGPTVEDQLDHAIRQFPHLINKAERPEDACLLVVGIDSFEKPYELTRSKHWNHGQNHYIFYSSGLFGTHGDRPFNTEVNFEMAATSQWSADDAFNREGFDTSLGLYPNWIRPSKYNKLDIHRKRRLLLAFKGTVHNWEQRNWQHRWIAAEYWHGEEGVFVDTKCGKRHDYEDTNLDAYPELLLNSTFFFCPGGGGVNSYRFPEALQGGAIPVVTSDFVPPFHPDIDWSGCIVRVSEARVVDVPNIVRHISEEEVRIRQRTCANLLETVFGNPPNLTQHFTIAMQVWTIRIRNALRMKSELEALTLIDESVF